MVISFLYKGSEFKCYSTYCYWGLTTAAQLTCPLFDLSWNCNAVCLLTGLLLPFSFRKNFFQGQVSMSRNAKTRYDSRWCFVTQGDTMWLKVTLYNTKWHHMTQSDTLQQKETLLYGLKVTLCDSKLHYMTQSDTRWLIKVALHDMTQSDTLGDSLFLGKHPL